MSYWLQVLKNSGSLGTIIILSVLITIMGLLSPIFIIHIFNRYISFGLEGTLIFLMLGALSVAIFEFFFRNLRNKVFSKIIINPIQVTKLDFIKNYFTRVGKNSKIIFCGDYTQTDLTRETDRSGLLNFMKILKGLNDFVTVEFKIPDIVRSDFLKEYIVEKYKLGY